MVDDVLLYRIKKIIQDIANAQIFIHLLPYCKSTPSKSPQHGQLRTTLGKTFRVYSEHSENTKITLREHLRSVPSCAGCHLIENKLILIYTISQLKISLMVWRISRIAKSPSFVCELSSFLIVSLSSVALPLLSYIGVWSKKRGENAFDSDD